MNFENKVTNVYEGVNGEVLDSRELGEILDKIGQEIQDEFFPKLKTKLAKKNFRTEEGLERAIVEGINDAFDELSTETDISIIRKKGKDKIYRSAFYYINEPLIYSVVRKFDNLSLGEEERVSAAQKGFVTAMNLFDPDRGFQFSTFAYRLMFNEIIALDKERKKQSTIKYNPRDVLAPSDLKVIRLEKAVGHRIVRINKEVQTLYNVTIVRDGEESEYTYNYLYRLNPKVKVGAALNQGELIGTLDGAEVDLESVEGHIHGERSGETIFLNPMDSKSEGYRRPDRESGRETIVKVLKECIASLSEPEIMIVEKRLLPLRQDRTTLKDLSSELGISQQDVKKLQERVLLKLREKLEEKGIEAKDVEIFE